jgi:hypothetical protein
MESQEETKVTQQPMSIKTDAPGTIIAPGKLSAGDIDWRELLAPILDFLGKAPDSVGSFFSDYKKPLLTLILFLSGIVTVYITLAVLDAVNDIPLLAPIFELIGIGYTAWFVYRYLLRASTRSELVSEFESLKTQVVGKNAQNN